MKHLSNAEIAKLLATTGDYYEMEDVPFKPRAYARAAETIDALDEEVEELYRRGGRRALEDIPGVGPGIAYHIEEILKRGTFAEYDRLRKKIPVDLPALRSVEGLGPKTIKLLYKDLRIKNLKELEAAVKAGKLRDLPRLGEKSEQKILTGIEFQKKNKGRFLLGVVGPIVQSMGLRLQAVPGVGHVTTAGSYRRWQETVGDIDLLVTTKNPGRVIKTFLAFPEIVHVYGKGPTKVNVRLRQGIDADLRVVQEDEYGSALQYFTGDKTHNVLLRKIAIKKGLKLSEYGLFRGKKRIAGRTEEEIYRALGLDCPPPELRTASGELEAARMHTLPNLIPYGSLQGDLQVQTDWTDGAASIENMARAASRVGLSYIAITDHTRSLAMTGGLDERKIAVQGREIDRVNKKLGKTMRVLKGSEVNILKDGRLDIADSCLKTLDVVAAAVHSNFNLSMEAQTERIIRALRHPLVNILFHPTGRKIGSREPYKIDILKVLRAAKQYGVAMEANAAPERLDLKDTHIREAVRLGVKLVVDSDAHAPNHFSWLDYGVAQVRRGWGKKSDVLNTKPCEEFLRALKGLKRR